MYDVLSVEHLRKVYGSKHGGQPSEALSDVSFTVSEGEFVGIMGPSGAGETTLLNVIATIDAPSGGKVFVRGKEITRLREPALSDFRRDALGFIFQDYNLLDTLSLFDNIALPLVLMHRSPQQIGRAVSAVSEDLGIADILSKFPYEVSGGQRQRAAAARAIVHQPELILADEPTGALDSKSSKDLLTCLKCLNQTRSATILMVTHDPFAASFASRILFIKDGALYMEIESGGDRRAFYDRILKALSSMGGSRI